MDAMFSLCRACGAPLGTDVLLRFSAMPCGAQHLPTRETLAADGSLDLIVVQCPSCGVVQLTNPPVPYWRDVIRAVSFSGPMYAIGCLLRGETPEFTACEQLWDYLYTGDCARALWHMALSGTDGVAYPLGSGQQRPLKAFLEDIRRIVNPKMAMRYGARPYPEGQVMRMQADIQPLQQDTGFTPAMTFMDGIRSIVIRLNPTFVSPSIK